MKGELVKERILANLHRIDIASPTPDAAQFQAYGETWRITKSVFLGYPEIHISVGRFRAWVYRCCDDPNITEYKKSGFSIELY